jgi:uncharacterized protein affecting Mg2+/Co2+ transport
MASTKTEAAKKGYNMGAGPDGKPLPDFDKWDKIQTGFAPYWHPEQGKYCFGRVVAKDNRNPRFVRYLLVAECAHECRRGPKNEDSDAGAVGEWVKVKAGDTFSITSYHAMSTELDYQLYLLEKFGAQIPIRILAEKKVKTAHEDGNRTCWQFDVRNAPEHTKILTQHRGEYLRLVSGGEEREQLEA